MTSNGPESSGLIVNHLKALLGRIRMRVGRPPRPGMVRFGSLRRVTPISRHFGYDRGQPVDRHYIEGFLERHRADIHGHVLEVGDDSYTNRFGGDRVAAADVLHVNSSNRRATIVGDLAEGASIPSESFDCVILTQTLQLIYNLGAALGTLHRILRPGGVLLMTVPGITPIDRGEWGDTWYWSFTPTSVRRLLSDWFPAADIDVAAYGNVLAATAFLYGLSARELSAAELAFSDPLYPVVVAARACKSVGEDR